MQHVMNGAILRPTIANASDMVSTNYSLASAAPLSPLVPSIQSILRGAGVTRHAIDVADPPTVRAFKILLGSTLPAIFSAVSSIVISF